MPILTKYSLNFTIIISLITLSLNFYISKGKDKIKATVLTASLLLLLLLTSLNFIILAFYHKGIHLLLAIAMLGLVLYIIHKWG